jgi:hypothetical protein
MVQFDAFAVNVVGFVLGLSACEGCELLTGRLEVLFEGIW